MGIPSCLFGKYENFIFHLNLCRLWGDVPNDVMFHDGRAISRDVICSYFGPN